MRIDLTCPAEIFRTAMPTADIPAVSLTMYNLSDRVISSVEVTVRLLSAAGAEQEKMAFRGRALNGRPHSTFSMNVPMAPSSGVKSAEVSIDKVWFSDNDAWRRSAERSVEYDPNDLPASTALTNLRFAAGESAVGYPSQQEGLWVCVCGRPNPDREPVCARCRRSKNEVFSQFSRDAVENRIALRTRQLDLSTRSAREDTARLQRIREEEYNRKKSRRGRRVCLAVCFILCLALIGGLAFFGVPALRAGVAAREAETSDSPETLLAASGFLREYAMRGDAFALADTADLRRARILLSNGDTAGARDAVIAVDPENEEKKQLEADCLFAEANTLMAKEDYSGARSLFVSLGDYPGAADLASECLFAEAKDLLEAGSYSAARESFLSLGDYPEAASFASECLYRYGIALIDEGKYDDAIAVLSPIGDYADSRRQTLKCHYLKARAYEEDGNLDGAASEYLMAGDWEDAQEKTRETVYALAETAFSRNDLTSAQGLYASIPGYQDADEKNRVCLYALGSDAFDDMEYTRAYELLSALPEGYQKADSMRIRAAYQAGKNALAREEWEKAAGMLAAAGNYKNAEKLLIQAMEHLAGQYVFEEGRAQETPEPAETPAPDAYDASDYAVRDGE